MSHYTSGRPPKSSSSSSFVPEEGEDMPHDTRFQQPRHEMEAGDGQEETPAARQKSWQDVRRLQVERYQEARKERQKYTQGYSAATDSAIKTFTDFKMDDLTPDEKEVLEKSKTRTLMYVSVCGGLTYVGTRALISRFRVSPFARIVWLSSGALFGIYCGFIYGMTKMTSDILKLEHSVIGDKLRAAMKGNLEENRRKMDTRYGMNQIAQMNEERNKKRQLEVHETDDKNTLPHTAPNSSFDHPEQEESRDWTANKHADTRTAPSQGRQGGTSYEDLRKQYEGSLSMGGDRDPYALPPSSAPPSSSSPPPAPRSYRGSNKSPRTNQYGDIMDE